MTQLERKLYTALDHAYLYIVGGYSEQAEKHAIEVITEALQAYRDAGETDR